MRHGRVDRRDVVAAVGEVVSELPAAPAVTAARELFEQVALGPEFTEFLTLPAYDRLLELTDV
jgi:hypothetical protein